jgi:hypothetical protein
VVEVNGAPSLVAGGETDTSIDAAQFPTIQLRLKSRYRQPDTRR